jgi:type IV secretory pathway TrbF-like protein
MSAAQETLHDLVTGADSFTSSGDVPLSGLGRPARAATKASAISEDSWFLRVATNYSRGKATRERERVLLWYVSGLLAVISCVLGCALAYVALRVKVGILQVDEHGYVVPFKDVSTVSPGDPSLVRAKIRTLSDWIRDWRTVYTDPAAQQSLSPKVYAIVPKNTPAHADVADWYSQHPPLAVKGRTVDVTVHSVGRISQDVWRVEWSERERLPGMMPKAARFEAFLTTALSPPKNLADIQMVGMGLYITHIHHQQMKAAR